MLVKSNSVSIIATVSLFVASLTGESLPARSAVVQEWQLPSGTHVRDTGPRTYRFTVDYTTSNSVGEIVRRQRVIGEYTRGLPGRGVVWHRVTEAGADDATSALSDARTVPFMEGFLYRNDLASAMQPDFFRGFPLAAVVERNLVWDTGMIEHFGQNFFERLRLNEPYHVAPEGEDVHMAAVGTFHNRDIVLEWIGRTRRNGQECALISYHAFLNPLRIENRGMTLNGRSDYWGEIWVSLATKQIEYATLDENVMGEMQLGHEGAPTLISVFRSGVFEPLSAK